MITEILIITETLRVQSALYFRQEKSFRDLRMRQSWRIAPRMVHDFAELAPTSAPDSR